MHTNKVGILAIVTHILIYKTRGVPAVIEGQVFNIQLSKNV